MFSSKNIAKSLTNTEEILTIFYLKVRLPFQLNRTVQMIEISNTLQ